MIYKIFTTIFILLFGSYAIYDNWPAPLKSEPESIRPALDYHISGLHNFYDTIYVDSAKDYDEIWSKDMLICEREPSRCE